ncbi:MAG: histidinol-phosphatase [Termitinemataceae bacterium]|nr:MAG: histidinol-phosphatase [Termitinemataceae bacterium]
MKYSCLHTHTLFCDGKNSVEEYCQAAEKKGFCRIGFSAHAPLDPKLGIVSTWHLKQEHFDEYVQAVITAKKNWEGRLEVLLGVEADFFEGSKMFSDKRLDYVIGSIHFLTKTYCADSPDAEFKKMLDEDFGGDIWALIDCYYHKLELMIRNCKIDIIGHLDLVKRNNRGNKYFSETDERYKCHITNIAKIIGDTNCTVEVNTGGVIRGRTDEPYPSKYFLKELKKYNVKVMINADAHNVEHLGGYYDEAKEILLQAGYNENEICI